MKLRWRGDNLEFFHEGRGHWRPIPRVPESVRDCFGTNAVNDPDVRQERECFHCPDESRCALFVAGNV